MLAFAAVLFLIFAKGNYRAEASFVLEDGAAGCARAF